MENDNFISDNENIVLGYADLQLTTKLFQLYESSSVLATIENLGFDTVSGKIIFYEYGNEKNIYDTFHFESLAYKQKLTYECNLEKVELPNEEAVIIGVKIETDDELRYDACNEETVTIYQKIIHPVLGISVSPKTAELVLGEKILLEAQISPANATNKAVIWTSSNDEIVSVEQSGEVTALKVGSATVYAISEDGNKKAKCKINVTQYGYSVYFDTQGGNKIEPITNIEKGSKIKLPNDPVKVGYIFGGWYYQPGGKGNVFNEETIINETITVYAYWISEEDVPEGLWIRDIEEQVYTGKK